MLVRRALRFSGIEPPLDLSTNFPIGNGIGGFLSARICGIAGKHGMTLFLTRRRNGNSCVTA